jgi:hypothetical protein
VEIGCVRKLVTFRVPLLLGVLELEKQEELGGKKEDKREELLCNVP